MASPTFFGLRRALLLMAGVLTVACIAPVRSAAAPLGQRAAAPLAADPASAVDPGFDDYPEAVDRLPGGGYLVTGWVRTERAYDIAVARYTANGTLDPTFGQDGRRFVSFGRGSYDFAYDAAVDEAGRIVIVGTTYSLDADRERGVVVRLLGDGSLDPSFSGDGKALVTMPGDLMLNAVVILDDGSIVAVGDRATETSLLAVVKLTESGHLDASFSGNGKALILSPIGGPSVGNGVALQSGGRIVVAGSVDGAVLVARLRATGMNILDPSFGTGGVQLVDMSADGVEDGSALVVQGNDKIVVAGRNGDDVAVLRLLPNGALDPAFGAGGTVVTNLGWGIDEALAVDLDGAGRIVVGGTRAWRSGVVMRYTTSGVLDATFAGDGTFVIPDAGEGWVADVLAHQNGKVVAAGVRGRGGEEGAPADFTVSRFRPSGLWDTTFGGGDGVVATDVLTRATTG